MPNDSAQFSLGPRHENAMGNIKDAYDILTDAVDRLLGRGKKSKTDLARGLAGIASVLDAARDRFERREIPRREAHALVYLVNHSAKLAAPFRKKEKGLA